jgi:hypothetical protein
MPNLDFAKIAPHLTNPLVLVGFCLFLFFGLIRAVLKASTRQSQSRVVALVLKYGLSVAVMVTILGFGYAVFQGNTNTNPSRGPITQRADQCGSNVAGDGNHVTIDCEDKASHQK